MKGLAPKLDLVWAYASEWLLTSLIYWLIVHQFGTKAVHAFVLGTAKQWSTLTLYLFGAAVAVWTAVFASILLTPFGRFLQGKGVAKVYAVATAVPMGVFLATSIAATLSDVYQNDWLYDATFALLLYSLFNVWTLVTNVLGLISVYLAYQTPGHLPSIPINDGDNRIR